MQLGNRTNLADAQRAGQDANRASADAFAHSVLPVVRQIQAAGITGLANIAKALNDRGIRTARGGAWHNSPVRNLLARADLAGWGGPGAHLPSQNATLWSVTRTRGLIVRRSKNRDQEGEWAGGSRPPRLQIRTASLGTASGPAS